MSAGIGLVTIVLLLIASLGLDANSLFKMFLNKLFGAAFILLVPIIFAKTFLL